MGLKWIGYLRKVDGKMIKVTKEVENHARE